MNPREKLCSRRSSQSGSTAKPLGIGERRVERLSVDGGRHGDVSRVLHAALDLERGDPGGQQGGQGRDGGQVGGRQDARCGAAAGDADKSPAAEQT